MTLLHAGRHRPGRPLADDDARDEAPDPTPATDMAPPAIAGRAPEPRAAAATDVPSVAAVTPASLAAAPVIDPDVVLSTIPAGGIGVTLGDTFRLHSLPGSTYKIFLDFDGHVATDTTWNATWNTPEVVSPAFSLDGSGGFGEAELLAMQRIWQQVAEYFSPFNIDVTTEDPGAEALAMTGFDDPSHGIRVVITQETGKPYGGLTWIGSFNNAVDTPAYVYAANLGNEVHTIAVAATHEAGHALGLEHDGQGSSEYYWGHGTGAAAWAPVMGVGYSAGVVQWSRGQYQGATNTEDDLAVITSRNFGVAYRADEAGGTRATAAALGGSIGADGVATVQRYGVITGSGTANDIDRYSFTLAEDGSVELRVSAWAAAYVTGSATPVYSALPFGMLDAKLTLYFGNTVVASFNDATRQDGVISLSHLAGGTYSLAIDGTGWGSPNAKVPSGWTEYGSLGQYMITGTYTAVPRADTVPPAAPTLLGLLDDAAPVLGALAPGGVTNDTTPTLSGLAEAGSTVTLREGPTVLGSTVAAADGSWTLTSAALAQGTHGLALTATDAAGNVSAATPLALTIDSLAPDAPVILGPATAGAATADLLGQAEAGSMVTVFAFGTALGSVVADASGAWHLEGAGFAGSGYSYTASATDVAGNVSALSAAFAGPARLTVDQSAVTLTEAGSSAALVVRALGVTDPGMVLVVAVSGLDATEAQASATTLVLDASNGWAAPLTLTGVDDRGADGPQTATLGLSAMGAAATSLEVTTLNDETAAWNYTRAGIGTIEMGRFNGEDGVALTIAEKLNAAGSYVIDQRWSFLMAAPGDVVLHVKAEATEAMRLLVSVDGGTTWRGVQSGGVTLGARTSWDGDYLVAGATTGLEVRMLDMRSGTDTVQDSVAVDLMTMTTLVADPGALMPIG